MSRIQFNIKKLPAILSIASLFSFNLSSAQDLKVINSLEQLRQVVQYDSLQAMIEVKSKLPSIVYDLRYSTRNNFTGVKLYKRGNNTYLRLEVIKALGKVQAELNASGYELKIWDAYRPYSVTVKMWHLIGDEQYVANPKNGSNHNRGLAVDLTLLKDGKEVEMGTGYDNFSDTAHHSFESLPETILNNRRLLKITMEKHGFKALETEWWHFSLLNDRKYDVLDLSFDDLAKK